MNHVELMNETPDSLGDHGQSWWAHRQCWEQNAHVTACTIIRLVAFWQANMAMDKLMNMADYVIHIYKYIYVIFSAMNIHLIWWFSMATFDYQSLVEMIKQIHNVMMITHENYTTKY